MNKNINIKVPFYPPPPKINSYNENGDCKFCEGKGYIINLPCVSVTGFTDDGKILGDYREIPKAKCSQCLGKGNKTNSVISDASWL